MLLGEAEKHLQPLEPFGLGGTMFKRLSIVLFLCLAAGCAATRTAAPQKTDAHANASDTVRDGSSFDRAVIIKSSNEGDGIRQEYQWLRDKYPGCRMESQSLVFHEGRPYDVLRFKDAEGAGHEAYFDISSFFGKW
jgi:hypothetical protein